MQTLSGKVQYLRGLADGLQLDSASKEGRLLLKMMDVMESMSTEIEHIKERQDDQDGIIDVISESLEDVEDVIFEDLEDWDDDDDEDEDDWVEEASSGWKPRLLGTQTDKIDEQEEAAVQEVIGNFIEYECPHCQSKIYYDAKTFDLAQDHTCPDCGKELFPEEADPATDGESE